MGSSSSPVYNKIIRLNWSLLTRTQKGIVSIIMGNLRDAILPRIGPLFRDYEGIMVVNNPFIRHGYLGVSENNVFPPKSSILIEISI